MGPPCSDRSDDVRFRAIGPVPVDLVRRIGHSIQRSRHSWLCFGRFEFRIRRTALDHQRCQRTDLRSHPDVDRKRKLPRHRTFRHLARAHVVVRSNGRNRDTRNRLRGHGRQQLGCVCHLRGHIGNTSRRRYLGVQRHIHRHAHAVGTVSDHHHRHHRIRDARPHDDADSEWISAVERPFERRHRGIGNRWRALLRRSFGRRLSSTDLQPGFQHATPRTDPQ